MLCCGEERQTRFCPECGAKVREPHPLDGLLTYCRQKASHYRRDQRLIAQSQGTAEALGDDVRRESLARRMATAERQLARWGPWAEALAALILAGGEKP